MKSTYAPVAQLDRALVFGTDCQGFDISHQKMPDLHL